MANGIIDHANLPIDVKLDDLYAVHEYINKE